MKKTETKKQAPKRTLLQVRTLPNGYSVDLENEGFMFFTLQDLLEGLFVHVGMNRQGAMTKEEIKTLLDAIKEGSVVQKLQDEVNGLKATIDEQKKLISEQKKVIKELNNQLK